MAQKNFNQMTTKKLNALLKTASDEDKVIIEHVLAAREQAQAEQAQAEQAQVEPVITSAQPMTEYVDDTPLTPEEDAILKQAEKNNGRVVSSTKLKMTDDERSKLIEELKNNINHRCQVVPFNSIEWVEGYIVGVVEDKRSGSILYAVKTDDGRRIVKVHNSNLIRITDTIVTPTRKIRARAEKNNIEWTPEILNDIINKYISYVGRMCQINKGEDIITGRIMAITPDKRTNTLLYRIVVPTPTEAEPNLMKTLHKVVESAELKIDENFDEQGAQINENYKKRREAAAARTPLTPQDRVIFCEENVKKAEEKLQKVQAELSEKMAQLEKAKQELENYLRAQGCDDLA